MGRSCGRWAHPHHVGDVGRVEELARARPHTAVVGGRAPELAVGVADRACVARSAPVDGVQLGLVSHADEHLGGRDLRRRARARARGRGRALDAGGVHAHRESGVDVPLDGAVLGAAMLPVSVLAADDAASAASSSPGRSARIIGALEDAHDLQRGHTSLEVVRIEIKLGPSCPNPRCFRASPRINRRKQARLLVGEDRVARQ